MNDPPSFTKGADQVDLEDAGPQSVPNWVTAVSPGPPDESGQTVTFLIDSNTNSALFAAGPAVGSNGTLSYTPAANANGSATIVLHAHDNGGGATDDSPTQSFTITLTPVNDAPSFTKGPDQAVLENSGPKSVSGWASAISKGPADEAGQTVSFAVTTNNSGLFSVDPAISAAGTLTFTPAPSENGTATVSVKAVDNGGTANGGHDTSPTLTFTITVTGVNDPPSFTRGPDQIDLEDAGPQSVSGWATNISPGPPDEMGQSVTFVVDGGSPDLFSSGPAVAPNGTLTYTPAADANGVSTVTLHAHDSGGGSADSPPQSFKITLTAVNDAPSFTKGPNPVVLENAPAQSIPGWAVALEGPTNEASQTVTYHVTSNTNSALFSGQPSVSPSGTLTFTAAPDAVGSATMTLTVQDNGGTANGGIDTSPPQTFTVSVTGVNDPPSFTKGINQTVLEDAGAQSITGWASRDQPRPSGRGESGRQFRSRCRHPRPLLVRSGDQPDRDFDVHAGGQCRGNLHDLGLPA